jgi:8-oxo-dGTP diphosphatase
MRSRTLVFPVDRPLGRVLLGRKKRDVAPGRLAGFGGKVEPGETVAAAAARKLLEESGLRAREHNLWYAARLHLVFPAQPEWDQVVHVFRLEFWEGEPEETEEIRPEWFVFDELPWAEMWANARYWLPGVLAGERLRMRFTYEDDGERLLLVERDPWEG